MSSWQLAKGLLLKDALDVAICAGIVAAFVLVCVVLVFVSEVRDTWRRRKAVRR